MFKNWKFWVGILITVLFIVWAIRLIPDWGKVGEYLLHMNYFWVIPALLIYFVGVWLRAVRWRYLLLPLRPIKSSRLFPVVVIGYMANNVLPLRTGELVRAYVLGEREGVSKSGTLATIVVERLLDGITMLLYLAIAALFFPGLDPSFVNNARIAGLMLGAATLVLLALAIIPSIRMALTNFILRLLPAGIREKVAVLLNTFLGGLNVLQNARGIITALLLSCLLWLCEAGMYVLIGIGFGLHVPPVSYLLATAAGNLAALIPAAPGNIGAFDVAAAASIWAGGASIIEAGGYVSVLHVVLLVPITLLGFYYLWATGISLTRLGRLGKEQAQAQPPVIQGIGSHHSGLSE